MSAHHAEVHFTLDEQNGLTAVRSKLVSAEITAFGENGGKGDLSMAAILAHVVLQMFQDGSLIAEAEKRFGIDIAGHLKEPENGA